MARLIAVTSLLALLCSMAMCRRDSNTHATNKANNPIYLNRDLSSGDLSQWTHIDYGHGTDVPAKAGYVSLHANVGGRRAVGLTATPTSHASPAASSDSVYLWEPTQFWNYEPYEIWLGTSVMFPSATTIARSGTKGEAPFTPTTGGWNWLMEFHDDNGPWPSCADEQSTAFGVVTDDIVQNGAVGTTHVRLAARIAGGQDCSGSTVWVDGPQLSYDHWYEFLVHVKWSTSAGLFEWYIDDFSKPYYSNLNIPTLYSRPAGYPSPSYTSLTLANYRLHAPWNSTIYFGPLVVGATKAAAIGAF